MRGKSISSLDQLDQAMTGNGKAKNGAKPAVKKALPKAAPTKLLPITAFRVHTMAYNEKTKKYGKGAVEHFDDVSEVLDFVESMIDKGQGNGLHEVSVFVR